MKETRRSHLLIFGVGNPLVTPHPTSSNWGYLKVRIYSSKFVVIKKWVLKTYFEYGGLVMCLQVQSLNVTVLTNIMKLLCKDIWNILQIIGNCEYCVPGSKCFRLRQCRPLQGGNPALIALLWQQENLSVLYKFFSSFHLTWHYRNWVVLT